MEGKKNGRLKYHFSSLREAAFWGDLHIDRCFSGDWRSGGTVFNLPLYELKEKCIEQLKDGIPVVCMADDDKMCIEELQLWDNGSFDYVEVTGFDFEMSRKDYFQLKAGIASHSMLLTGVHIGENGKPERWKIENSYGTNGLHKGYYVCSDLWFEKYVLSAVISKKYILEINSGQRQNRNPFNIWDIM